MQCGQLAFVCMYVYMYTVDRENFAVKIITRSRSTAKIKHAKNKLRGDDQ